ncbi:MAG TPA: hypothetical protein PLF40_30530 [Kofleriaceae bacterium]|nr:hypothetical protein [Kofleriaceae bacterium]
MMSACAGVMIAFVVVTVVTTVPLGVAARANGLAECDSERVAVCEAAVQVAPSEGALTRRSQGRRHHIRTRIDRQIANRTR